MKDKLGINLVVRIEVGWEKVSPSLVVGVGGASS
jgi:hypothetical protein